MTKKHFQLVADEIRASYVNAGTALEADSIYQLAKRLAARFSQENPRFDHQRFFRACGF